MFATKADGQCVSEFSSVRNHFYVHNSPITGLHIYYLQHFYFNTLTLKFNFTKDNSVALQHGTLFENNCTSKCQVFMCVVLILVVKKEKKSYELLYRAVFHYLAQ